MSALSKIFDQASTSFTCKDIVHPYSNSCINAACRSFFKPIPTTAQFFLPIFLISLASKRVKIDGRLCKELLKNFVSVVSLGFLTGSIGTWCMCGLFKLQNKFKFYTSVCIPAMLGSSIVFAAPNNIAIMFAHSALVILIEILVKKRQNFIFNEIETSTSFRTLIFMALSGILLDSLRSVKPDITWFLQPLKHRPECRFKLYEPSPLFDSVIEIHENVCSHKFSCDKFNIDQIKLYLNIGLGIEVARNFIKHFAFIKTNYLGGIWMIIKSIKWKFIAFTVGYPSAYRLLSCLFNRYTGSEQRIGNFLAASFAGIFFCIYPSVPIFAHALACTIEILWQRYQESDRSKPKIAVTINNLPLAKIFYCLGLGYLFHVRAFYPWQTPSHLQNLMNLVSCGHTEEMLLNFYKILMP